MIGNAALIGAASFALALTGAWLVRRHGLRWGLCDVPSDRSSHRRTTPKGGGIGITAAVVLTAATCAAPPAIWVPAAMVSTMGLVADRFDVSPVTRLTVMFLLSGWTLAGIARPPLFGPEILAPPLLAVFLVGTANFYNFMDGIDGIAALSGIVGFGLLAWHGAGAGADPAINWLALGAAAGCAGFLPLNFPHARVFMGDSGSVLLGFLFAAIAVAGARTLADLICRAAFLLPFYCDEISTMALRVRDGESLVRPHRRHLYQLMANELSIPHARVALGYAVAQALMGASVLLAAALSAAFALVLIGVYAAAFCLLSFLVRRMALAAARS